MTKKYVIHDKKIRKVLIIVMLCYIIIYDEKIREV